MRIQRWMLFGGLLIALLHVGLAKHFDLAARLRLRWELTATNILNNPNWSNPATNISSLAQVGVISAVGEVSDLDPSGPRAFRMGIRLDW